MDYSKFSGLKSIVKSIRFELIPVGNTRKTMAENEVLEHDEKVTKNASDVKAASDYFVRKIIEMAADECNDIPWEALKQAYLDKNIAEYEKPSAEAVKEILTGIEKAEDKLYKRYGVDKITPVTLIEAALPEFVKEDGSHEEYDKGEMLQKIADLKGSVTALFAKYNTAYTKILHGDGHGSVVSRTMENFAIYCDNYVRVCRFKEQCPDLYDEFMRISDAGDLLMNTNGFSAMIKQTGIDAYNAAIKGVYDSDGNKIQKGINELMNEACQIDKEIHLSGLKKLNKQILTKGEKAFLVSRIESDKEMKQVVEDVVSMEKESMDALKDVMTGSIDTSAAYVAGKRLSNVSFELTGGNFGYLKEAIGVAYAGKHPKVKVLPETDKGCYSFIQINELLAKGGYNDVRIEKYMAEQIIALQSAVAMNRETVQTLLLESEGHFSEDDKLIIKEYFESLTDVSRFIKYFECGDPELQQDFSLYGTLTDAYDTFRDISKAYMKVQSYCTRKPAEMAQKFAMCLGDPVFYANNWLLASKDRVKGQTHALIKKDGKYYYILPVTGAGEYVDTFGDYQDGDYTLIVIDKQSGFYRMGGKIVSQLTAKELKKTGGEFPVMIDCGNGEVEITGEFYDKYRAGKQLTDPAFRAEYIDKMKELLSVHHSYTMFDFSGLKASSEYKNLGEFNTAVDARCYRVSNRYIRAEQLEQEVENGGMYMFEIASQDLYRDQPKDVQAVWFKSFMESTGFPAVWLGAKPSMAYRPAVEQVSKNVTHKKGSVLVNRNYQDDNGTLVRIPDGIYCQLKDYFNGRKGSLTPEAAMYKDKAVTKVADRDITKDARYTREGFYITFSVTVNGAASGGFAATAASEMIKNNDMNILAVLRGEKHLLYYVLTDSKGKMLSQGDFDTIRNTNYQSLLKTIDGERKEDQRNWQYKKRVADIKTSYVGMATSQIVKMALDNNALIAIEALDEKYKDKHSCIDNQVYKKFETALVNKLSCYYDKTLPYNAPGGMLNPLQLADPDFDSVAQNGILIYVQPAYLKNTCRQSGFVNMVDFSASTIEKKRDALQNVKISAENGTIIYKFKYDEIPCKLSEKDLAAYKYHNFEWHVCADHPYITFDKKAKAYVQTDLLRKTADRITAVAGDGHVDTETCSPAMITAIYDLFRYAASGYIPAKDGDPMYVSPTRGEEMPWFENVACNAALKASMQVENIRRQLTLKEEAAKTGEKPQKVKVVVTKMDWLNSF